MTTYPFIAVYGKENNYDSAPKIIFPQFGSTLRKESEVIVDHPPPLEYYFKDALPLNDGKVILVGKLRDEQGKSILAIKVTLPEDPVGIRHKTAALVIKRENLFFDWNLLGRRVVQNQESAWKPLSPTQRRRLNDPEPSQ